MLKNTDNSYGLISKSLHWLVAVSVIIMLLIGMSLDYLEHNSLRYALIVTHESIGVVILVLMLVRLIWRWFDPLPTMPAHVPKLQYIIARVSHTLFYILVIAMPLSGLVMITAAGHDLHLFGLWSIELPWVPTNHTLAHNAHMVHYYIAWSLFGLIVIHTGAALFHHFVYRDQVLKRMLPTNRNKS